MKEVLLCEVHYNRCFKYHFGTPQDNQFIRSSGFLLSTGTGSSGLLKSIEAINLQELQKIAQALDMTDISNEELRLVQDQLNETPVFPCESDDLFAYHRDLIPGKEYIPKEAWIKPGKDERWVKNLSYKAIHCADRTESPLDFEDELIFNPCKPEEKLITIETKD